MSASREKKDRQGVTAQGMTQKQLKEAKEARAAKRKTITYWIVGVVIAVLVVALLVWDSGFFQKRAVGATVGDETFTVAEMQYYYGLVRSSEVNQQQMYAQYGISILADPYVMYDSASVDGDQQIYNTETNQTYAEHFRESALNTVKEIVALNTAAKDAGYALSADGKTSVQDNIKSIKEQLKTTNWASLNAYLGAVYGSYVDEGVYSACMEQSTLAGEYRTHYENALTYSTGQMDAYQQENPALLRSYDFRYAYIPGDPEKQVDENGETKEATDEEKAAATADAKAKADALVKGVTAAAADKKEDSFNTLVKDAVAADSSYADPTKNLQSGILGDTLSNNGVPYLEWLSDSARKAGDVTAISSGTGYYVVLFLKAELDNTPTSDIRHILIKADAPVDDEATADVDESTGMPTQEAMDAAKAKAQAILDEFTALSEDKRTAEAFGDLAKKNSADTSSAANGGLMRYVSLPNDYVESFNDWIFDASRKSGDTGLVENFVEGNSYAGYHVMYYVGQDGPKWHELAEDALRSDEMTKWLETIQAPITATWADNGLIGK